MIAKLSILAALVAALAWAQYKAVAPDRATLWTSDINATISLNGSTPQIEWSSRAMPGVVYRLRLTQIKQVVLVEPDKGYIPAIDPLVGSPANLSALNWTFASAQVLVRQRPALRAPPPCYVSSLTAITTSAGSTA
eukprot:m51a1_g12741 hypothetical protein (136) ;mRNA; f:2627-3180